MQTYEESINKRLTGKIDGILEDKRLNKKHHDLLKDFNIFMINKTNSIHTRYLYLDLVKRLAIKTSKDYNTFTNKDLMRFCADLSTKEGKSIKTVNAYKLAFNSFFKEFMKKPELTEGLKQQKPREREFNLLTVEEIMNMVKVSDNVRDKAILFTLYESGARCGEFLAMRLKHVKFDSYGALLKIPQGKTVSRTVRVIDCVPDLRKWIESHPDKNNEETPLWINIFTHQNQAMTNTGIKRIIVKNGKRCNVDNKKLFPHNLRHLRATVLSDVLNEMQLRVYFGWSKTSNMPSVYLHHNEDSVNNALLRSKGVLEDKTKSIKDIDKTENHKCPKCNFLNSVISDYCEKCWQPLTYKAIGESENKEQENFNKINKILQYIVLNIQIPDEKRKELIDMVK
jgi:integrase/recombinase XerD